MRLGLAAAGHGWSSLELLPANITPSPNHLRMILTDFLCLFGWKLTEKGWADRHSSCIKV